MRLLSNKKRHGNAYSFLEHFAYPSLRTLIGRFTPRLSKKIKDELEAYTKDWYFLKDKTMVIRYRFFDTPFYYLNILLRSWLA